MDLQGLVRDQDGVVTHAQALRFLSRWAVSRRVADREWAELFPRTYLDRTHLRTRRAKTRAAALWAGDRATLVGPSAALWWGLAVERPGPVTLAVPPGVRLSPQAGVRLVRQALRDDDRWRLDGLWVTTMPVTVLDTAVALGGTAGRAFLDRALQEHTTLEELREAHESRPRRRGAPAAVELLRRAADRTASEPERIVLGLLRSAGVAGFEVNHTVRLPQRTVLIDIAFRRQKVAIEIAGWAFHRDRDRFVDDARRWNDLTAAGWLVLQFTWDDVTRHPEAVVARIVEVLAARS